MTRDESAAIDTAALVSRVHALIERSALGAEGPRQLRGRASREQLERIRRLRLSGADTSAGPSEASARRLIAEALGETGLPQRTPDPDRTMTGPRPGSQKIDYSDPAYSAYYRTDTATLVRVVERLRGSTTCPR
ncbi:hypothetical protein [Nocardia carnea]|uniref:hypothetical protein n=1 Tax=Nocardia carnea TaxID=37328 RepID=UPI00245804A6|nr:hypothetical protein [Nocardia carnea]